MHVMTQSSVVKAEVKKLLSVKKKDANGPCHFRYSVLTEDAGSVAGVYEAHQLLPLFKGGSSIMFDGLEGPVVGVVIDVPSIDDPWTIVVEILGGLTRKQDENGGPSVYVESRRMQLDLRNNIVRKVCLL